MDEPRNTPTAEKQGTELWLARLAPLVALLVLVGLMVACRGTSLSDPTVLNPDEAELLATGRRAALNLTPYSVYTTPTFLFLWPFLLGVLSSLGLTLTISLGHILSGAAYVWIAFAVWFGVSRYWGWLLAGLVILPTSAYLFASSGDFRSLGTELLPASLVLLACIIIATGGKPLGRWRLFAASLTVGLSIWAKPQVLFIALAIVVAAVLIRAVAIRADDGEASFRELSKDCALALLGFFTPSVIFILWMAAAGTLNEFISEPVAFNWLYSTSREQISGGEPVTTIARLEAVGNFVIAYPIALAWAIVGLFSLRELRSSNGRTYSLAASTVWLAPLLALGATLLVTIPLFTHYANLIFVTCGAVAILATRLARDHRTCAHPTPRGRPSFALLGAAMLITLSAALIGPIDRNLKAMGDQVPVATRADPVRTACPSKSSVLVWGWASELYSYYDWTPASRYSGVGWLSTKTGRQATYAGRLMDEIENSPPTCIVEAIGPQFFGGLSPEIGIRRLLPSLTPFLNRCYTASAEVLADVPNLPVGRTVLLFRWNGRCQPPSTPKSL